jgi:hypothetical protein
MPPIQWFEFCNGSVCMDIVYDMYLMDMFHMFICFSFSSWSHLPVWIHKMSDHKYLYSSTLLVWRRQWLWRHEWWKPHLLQWVRYSRLSFSESRNACLELAQTFRVWMCCFWLSSQIDFVSRCGGSCFRTWLEGTWETEDPNTASRDLISLESHFSQCWRAFVFKNSKKNLNIKLLIFTLNEMVLAVRSYRYFYTLNVWISETFISYLAIWFIKTISCAYCWNCFLSFGAVA